MRARLLPLLWLVACAGSGSGDTDPAGDGDPAGDTDPTGDTDDTDVDGAAPDYQAPGPATVVTSSGDSAVDSCTMKWDLYTPEGAPSDTLVVLSHGFARNKSHMAGHGAHLASWGLHVVTPDLCHTSPFDTDHPQNGKDLAEVAGDLGYTRVIYAGHSAGGLASVLAGAQDADAIAVFTLDGVDNADLGLKAAAELAVPFAGLVGDPSSCNSTNNGAPWFAAAPDGRGLRVTEADHCTFEDPTDGLCTGFCGTGNPTFSDEALAATVRGLTTSWLLWRSGVDPRGETGWTPGSAAYDDLVANGAITEL